jgi:hypothetical protein
MFWTSHIAADAAMRTLATQKRAHAYAARTKLRCGNASASGIRSYGNRSGGARRDRTDDLLLAKQALSQLSYGPVRNQQPAIGNQKQNALIAGYRRLISENWWAWEDLNFRPHAYQARALTS